MALSDLRRLLVRALPQGVRERLRAAFPSTDARRARLAATPSAQGPGNVYEKLYEEHGRHFSDEVVVGGLFDLVGKIEFGLLLMEGLRPTDTVIDFGCGTGRLAVRLIPELRGGHYIGVDVSQSMLDKAQRLMERSIPEPSCRVSWVKQTTPTFPLDDHSVDLICAFSVFTHIEHEDTYRYLKDALRIVRPQGRFIFSCLPMSLAAARDVFLAAAREDFQGRWSRVRNVTTSVDLMDEIARLAGWRPIRWYAGDQANIRLPDTGELVGLGQSSCVLEARPLRVRPVLAPDEVGRVVLTWEVGSLTLVPHFAGPLPDGAGRFHLVASTDGDTQGRLGEPPFAALTLHAARQAASLSVTRLVPGVYRYWVTTRQDAHLAGESLAHSGARVEIWRHESPEPIEFTVPAGDGPCWGVFDVVLSAHEVLLRPVNRWQAAVDEPGAGEASPP